MLATIGVILVFLGVICVSLEAIGSAALFGALGMSMMSHAA